MSSYYRFGLTPVVSAFDLQLIGQWGKNWSFSRLATLNCLETIYLCLLPMVQLFSQLHKIPSRGLKLSVTGSPFIPGLQMSKVRGRHDIRRIIDHSVRTSSFFCGTRDQRQIPNSRLEMATCLIAPSMMYLAWMRFFSEQTRCFATATERFGAHYNRLLQSTSVLSRGRALRQLGKLNYSIGSRIKKRCAAIKNELVGPS